jgi:predicted metalloendopeptidase
MPKPRAAAVLASLLLAGALRASVDTSSFDTSVRPQDDFFRYVNGGWIARNPIPADHSSWGAFDELENRNETVLRSILEKAELMKDPGPIERMVGDFYHSGMDIPAVDTLGASPLAGELGRIGAIRTAADVGAEVARLHRLGMDTCFSLGSEQDPRNSERVIAGEVQGGLGLPDRDYYLREDADSGKLRGQYVSHVARMLELAGDARADAEAGAKAVMRLETGLAKGSSSQVDLRDPVANYHLMPLAEIQRLTPSFDWRAYLSGIGLPEPSAIDIGQPEFLKVLDALIAQAPAADWRAYLRWHLIHDNAPYLSEPFVNENFAFFGNALSGTPRITDRWRRVLDTENGAVGEELGQLFVARAFPPQAKARAQALVSSIRSALRARIERLEWMDAPTRAAALAKLDMLGVKVGYPDKWIDYGALRIDRGPYVLNVLRASEFNVRRDLAKIGKPVDRTLWGMPPQSVNAYYDPSMNEIVIAAGILQPPFFTQGADDAVNYGAIGAVIGHEMTHGFDDEGRQYDGKGNLSDWWSAESAKRFRERSGAIVRQFGAYVAVDDLHINGELTQGENIADLGGLKIAYAAYMEALAARPAGAVGGFTPQQRFFISFASIWRSSTRPETIRLLVNTDPHSPERFRVNGPLSNLDEFAAAFGVPEGSPMRRPAAQQVVIW